MSRYSDIVSNIIELKTLVSDIYLHIENNNIDKAECSIDIVYTKYPVLLSPTSNFGLNKHLKSAQISLKNAKNVIEQKKELLKKENSVECAYIDEEYFNNTDIDFLKETSESFKENEYSFYDSNIGKTNITDNELKDNFLRRGKFNDSDSEETQSDYLDTIDEPEVFDDNIVENEIIEIEDIIEYETSDEEADHEYNFVATYIEKDVIAESDYDIESIYGMWDEDIDSHPIDNNTNSSEPALSNIISSEDKKRTIAAKCIIVFDWNIDALEFLIDFIPDSGYNKFIDTIQDQIKSGASYEEIVVAYHIKKEWSMNSAYWISFEHFYVTSGSTSDTYKSISLKDCVRFVRSYSCIPDFEDIIHTLDEMLDCWYASTALRLINKSFYSYVFQNLLNDRNNNPSSAYHDYIISHEEIDTTDYSSEYDELQFLENLGINIFKQDNNIKIHIDHESYFTLLNTNTPGLNRNRENDE